MLGTDADEILVEAAKPLRADPGSQEHALVKGFNQQMLELFTSAMRKRVVCISSLGGMSRGT